MATSLDEFTSTANDSCSNIYLTDENLCLSKSYEIFNTNFYNISTQLLNLSDYSDSFYNIYTIFTQNSANWMNAYSTVSTLSAKLNSAYSTVNTLSSYLQKTFEITYPSFINFDLWYNNISNYKNVVIAGWLSYNFPANNYASNQKITVNINLFKSVPYNFTFSRDFYEDCYIYAYDETRCTGCGIGEIKCNHPDKKEKDEIPGCNLCNNCGVVPDTRTFGISCSSAWGAAVLRLRYNKSVSDNFIPRNIKVSYINISNSWVLTS